MALVIPERSSRRRTKKVDCLFAISRCRLAERKQDADDQRRQVMVEGWLRFARVDLAAADALLELDRDDIDPWVMAFHAQQAAEKAAKRSCSHSGSNSTGRMISPRC